MATHGGIGVYLDSGPAPANIADRPWLGVHHHYDGQPDGLGDELVRRVVKSRSVQQVVNEVIHRAPNGWVSFHSNEQSDEPWEIGPRTGNTCYIYLFDVAARRLDAFATHAEASGEFIGSVQFAKDGSASPPAFVVTEPPPPVAAETPIQDSWAASTAQARDLRIDVERRTRRDCEAEGLTLEGFVELVNHALSECVFQAPWSSDGVPTNVDAGWRGPWRVQVGDLTFRYPPTRNNLLRTTIEGDEFVTFFRPGEAKPVELNVRKSDVTRSLGVHAEKVFNILVSAFPADWLWAFLDLARSLQVPGSATSPSFPVWRVFRHEDGRVWAIREAGSGYLLRLGDPADPVLKERPSKSPNEEVESLIASQLADGFVAGPDEPV